MSRTCASSTLFHSGKMTKLNDCKCRSTISLSGLQHFCTAAVFFVCGNMKFLVKRGTKDILTVVDKISQHTSDSVLWWLKNCQLFVSLILTFLISLCQTKYIGLRNNTVRRETVKTQLLYCCPIYPQ